MKLKSILLGFYLIFLVSPGYATSSNPFYCQTVFENAGQERTVDLKVKARSISEADLVGYVSKKIDQVLEFQFIRNLGIKMGVRVWLFGGTSSSFLHYAKWDLARSQGLIDLQKDRFDYDFTNIFRSTQDIDLVVDADPEVAREFQRILVHRFPHFLGDRSTGWEVRTLRHRIHLPGRVGYKEALLEDTDFQYQNTDSNSVGMIEITQTSGEPVIRDLKSWGKPTSIFLQDTLQNRIRFLRSDRHFETSRAKTGENPEILSVLRLLVKAFQYDLKLSSEDTAVFSKIAHEFQPDQVTNLIALRRIGDTAKKLVIHAVDIETAMNTLDQLGLRRKLISMGIKGEINSFAWWLNREPLRSKPVGQGQGATAKELGIQVVSHDTKSLAALESITRAHSGKPNVLISRHLEAGETALFGDGFYVTTKESYSNSGFPIRFRVDPDAREGTDFTVHERGIIRFHNKMALNVIPNSLFFELEDIIHLSELDYPVKNNQVKSLIFEKQFRRLTSAKIMAELEPLISDHSSKNVSLNLLKTKRILNAIYHPYVHHLISHEVRSFVFKDFLTQLGNNHKNIPQSSLRQYAEMIREWVSNASSHDLIVPNQEHWIDFLVAARWNREIREILFDGYALDGFKKFHILMDLIFDAQDISNSQVGVLLRELGRVYDLKVLNQSIAAEEIFKIQTLLSGTKIEEQWFDSFLSSFYPPTDFNHEGTLGRMLVLSFYSPKSYYFNYALRLIDAPELARFSIVNAFRQIIALREIDSVFGDFELAANYWMSSEGVHQDLKAAFLLLHLGRPQYGKYWGSLPKDQKLALMKGFKEKTLIPVFHKWALEQEGSSSFTFIRKESFEFVPQVFPKTGIRVRQGNPSRNIFDGSWMDRPEHEVTLTKSYEIQVTPVTQFQWAWVMGENPSQFQEGGQEVMIEGRTIKMHPNRPVENVSWDDVQNFLKKLNSLDPDYDYRLPTEAEWEYSARGGTETKFSFGEKNDDLNLYAWNAYNSGNHTHDVASLRSNPYGLYDVHGNVWEWVHDWDSLRLSSENQVNPRGPLFGRYRIVRGDSAENLKILGFRSTQRHLHEPRVRDSWIGFRLVRTLKN